MTAEEKLREWYKECEPLPATRDKKGNWTGHLNPVSGIYIAPEHIDLIANLVIERILNEKEGHNGKTNL